MAITKKIMDGEEMTSLGDLATELKVKKSKLLYYYNFGLLDLSHSAGGVRIFKKAETVSRISKIISLQKKGNNLREIKELL